MFHFALQSTCTKLMGLKCHASVSCLYVLFCQEAFVLSGKKWHGGIMCCHGMESQEVSEVLGVDRVKLRR